MDPRNLDARDLAPGDPAVLEVFPPGLGTATHLSPAEMQPAVVEPVVARSVLVIDPELPSTIEELRNLIRNEVIKVIANSDQIRALVAAVPRGEA